MSRGSRGIPRRLIGGKPWRLIGEKPWRLTTGIFARVIKAPVIKTNIPLGNEMH
jgi:hypothetical protein